MPDVEQPHHGRWFEELPVGTIVPHPLTRTVTETDNVIFTTMTMNPAQLHLDYEYAAATEFGKPLVNTLFTLGLLVGISVLETTHGTTVANLGFEEVVFPAPMFDGDTLHAETEVVAARRVEVATRPGHRDVRAPRLQPARRAGLPGAPQRADAPASGVNAATTRSPGRHGCAACCSPPRNKPDVCAKMPRSGARRRRPRPRGRGPARTARPRHASARARVGAELARRASATSPCTCGSTRCRPNGSRPTSPRRSRPRSTGVVVPKLESADAARRRSSPRSTPPGSRTCTCSPASRPRWASSACASSWTAPVRGRVLRRRGLHRRHGRRPHTGTAPRCSYARSRVRAGRPARGRAGARPGRHRDSTTRTLFARRRRQGRSLGYPGKLCIHPAQVALAHRAFSPSPEESTAPVGSSPPTTTRSRAATPPSPSRARWSTSPSPAMPAP